ncbi:MAG: 50S ribosomal protein L18 [Gammaproteobacteria bacterium]|nr:50S ribosomal protein L18 [Gammaproteobacteria bacterium]
MIKIAKTKKEKRLRRAKKARYKIKTLEMPRFTVHKTLNHIYAQVLLPNGQVIASASTIDKAFKKQNSGIKTGNMDAATKVGKLIAKRVLDKNIKEVAFDRSGFKYHGRVKALAEAAREGGLIF